MNRYLRWTENRYAVWALYGIFAALFFYFAYTIGNYIINPYFSEFREGHTFSSTYLLEKGIRPFTLETYPEYYNSYGIVFNLVVTPFALLFGNTLILHRIINELFLVGTIAFLAIYQTPRRFTFAHLIIMLTAWWLFNYCTNNSVRPDGLGVFLYTLCIFIPLRRGFDGLGMILSMLCALLAFYTKVYFVGGWYLLSVALLFHSWKKFLVYNVCFHSLLVLSAAAVFQVFPLYFYETIFAYNSSSHNIALLELLLYSVKQFCRFSFLALPILLYILIPFRKSIFIENRLLVFMMLPCALVLFYPLGTNIGANTTYHTHLMLPLLLPLALNAVQKVRCENLRRFAALAFIMPNLWLKIPFSAQGGVHWQKVEPEWQKIEQYVNQAHNVLNSDCLSYLLMKQNKELVTDGVSGFVYGYHPSPLTQCLFGLDNEILKRKEQYINRISTGLREKKFDLIILSDIDSKKLRAMAEAADGYQLIDKIDILQRGIPALQFSVYKPIK